MKTIKFLGILVLSLAAKWACAQEAYVVITPTPVNVYENSVADAKVIGMLQPKQSVEVYVVNGDWAIVKYNNGVGYVPGACLKKAEKPAAQQPAAETAKPAAETVKPAVAPAVPQQAQPEKPAAPVAVPAEPARQQPEPVSFGYPGDGFHRPYHTYSLISKKNNIARVLDCPSQMYLSLGYQRAELADEMGFYQPNIQMGGGFFDFGGIIRLWGPIGLDASFGLGMNSKRLSALEDERLDIDKTQYDKIARTKLDYRLNLAPVFWVNLNSDVAAHVMLGPHWNLTFMDLQTYNRNGERDFGPQKEYAGFEKNDPYRFVGASWIAAFGLVYNHVGFRVSYEWEYRTRYKDPYITTAEPFLYQRRDPRYSHLDAALFFSFAL